jgi:hypothetical protein
MCPAFARLIPTARLQTTAAWVLPVFEAYTEPACSTLVKQQFENGGTQADAAFAALAALNSYNRTNKLATLHELVRRLIDGDEKVQSMFLGVKMGTNDVNQQHAHRSDSSVLHAFTQVTGSQRAPAAELTGSTVYVL